MRDQSKMYNVRKADLNMEELQIVYFPASIQVLRNQLTLPVHVSECNSTFDRKSDPIFPAIFLSSTKTSLEVELLETSQSV